MKKLLLLLLPLFFTGCKIDTTTEHAIQCIDSSTKLTTINTFSYGPVYAFTVKGKTVLDFKVEGQSKPVLVDLTKYDCGVN